MTPSGRAGVGLTEDRKVHLFERTPGGDWHVLRAWDAARHSHTDILIALGDCEEPTDPKRLLDLVPPS
jgi:hypothetical protein